MAQVPYRNTPRRSAARFFTNCLYGYLYGYWYIFIQRKPAYYQILTYNRDLFAIRLLAVNKTVQKNKHIYVSFSDFGVWQLQPSFRRNAGIVDIHLKVQMVAGAVAGAAHRCNRLALGYGLTCRNGQGGTVCI